jgi:hypothetical protein
MASRSQSKTSTDHDEIRQWAEARAGRHAVVKSTRGKGDDTGILRIDFPGYSGAGSLEQISWEEFFEKFDREKLALVYQETTARGQKSNFNKIVSRETVRSAARAAAAERANPAVAPAAPAASAPARRQKKRRAKPQAQAKAAPRANVRAPGQPRRENRPAVKRLNAAREAGEMFPALAISRSAVCRMGVSQIDKATAD